MDPDLEKALAKRLEKVKVEEQDSQESGSSQNVVNETFAETSQTPTRLPSNAGQFAKFGTKAFPGQREVVNLFPLFLILLLLVYIFYVFRNLAAHFTLMDTSRFVRCRVNWQKRMPR